MASRAEFSRRVQDLTERLRTDGVEALGPLFDLTSHRLVRYAVTITRNQHDAEDAVQTALVRVAGRPSQVGAATSSWSYLLRMVRNDALLIARRKKRCTPAGDLTDLVTACRVDAVQREESYRAVWSALRTLPAEQAEVVVLKIWEGMTFVEIGDVLEQSPHTAASLYRYAMTKLAQRLAPQEREVYHD